MEPTQSPDPNDRIGVFKQLEDVPAAVRLEQYETEYEGNDVWGTFLVTELFPSHNSYRTKQTGRLAGRRWKDHIENRERHHALARPVDVETWCERLLSDVNTRTAYKTYWSKLERFYTWLLWHTEHPHLYHPVLMAAAQFEHAGEVWTTKIEEAET
ncbi:hypothetical protein [Halorientalis marina]|uniref:hypothetical protein n=1 Tax=Halorientalis marina TaxID=2931976 RepID=UPI001FF10D67|nr:hypothetical protein [Halorientalis marina]